MRKILFLLAAVIFLSCEGPMGEPGPRGPKGDGTNWAIKRIVVKESDWKLKGVPGDLNSYYYADKTINELTQFVFEEGTIVSYIETEPKIKNGMPYVLHRGGLDQQGKEFLWTQTYDFDFYQGGISFFLTYSNFNTKMKPEEEIFHVVLMW